MTQSYYKHGEWSAICDTCGWKFKSSELRETWDHRMVCKDDWEPRHPSDYLRGRADKTQVPYVSPESTDTFISVTYAASTVGVQENTIPTGTFNNNI